MSVNKCIFIGRLGKDPEIRVLNNDLKFSNFSIACSEKWTDKQTGEPKEVTEWINCQTSGRLSDVVEKYVHKGDQLYIEGKYKTRYWEKDGVKHYSTYIQVEKIELLGSKKENQTEEKLPTYESNPSRLPPSEMAHSNRGNEPEPQEEDDLPF